MSDLVKDIGKLWYRLFDHKNFLFGEISFMLCEFEEKREDREVDNLFNVIEHITEIKATEIQRCNQVGEQILDVANQELQQALNTCSKFSELEEKYKKDQTLELARYQRKAVWDNFMDGITEKYSEINSNLESNKQKLKKYYEDIEKKLLV